MANQILLRDITESDLQWALELRNKNKEFFFDNRTISQEEQRDWYSKLDSPFFIIEYNGEKAGTIAIRRSHGKLEMHNVIIDEPYRKKGILKQAIALILEKYTEPLYLDVKIDNNAAIETYKKLGFTPLAYRMRKK